MNRLAGEQSPYLQQHAHNPVDWFPWGEEAFVKAREMDRPIFLSIGYSTCHWCHVMERESFEDDEVADLLNRYFVAIKVDREERPDVDHVYMTACQAMTGSGGWPLTVLMTPDKKPFYVGTYFPKTSRHGLPGLLEVLRIVAERWSDDRGELVRAGDSVTESLQPRLGDTRPGVFSEAILHAGFRQLRDAFDPEYGGFGPPPKFPSSHNLSFLLGYWRWTGADEARTMVEETLDAMHAGGIYDHLGYGFSRYSVDRAWLVPHFEKMLYDNALLAATYLEGYQATGRARYARVADEVLQYILRDMTGPEGGFYSAEDADSEGEEGKFYLWSQEEIHRILGPDTGERFCRAYGVTEAGNFEGKNILNRIAARSPFAPEGDAEPVEDGEFEDERNRLFAAREERVRPQRDDKVLTGWNALAITAMARASRVLDRPEYLGAAVRAAEFLWTNLRDENGRLLARYRAGEAGHLGYVDDYAFFIGALLDLYDADMKPIWLDRALRLQRDQDRLFLDEAEGGYFFYGSDGEALLARPKEIHDGALPSGNAISALNLLRMGRLTGDETWSRSGEEVLGSFAGDVTRHPAAYGQSLVAMLFALVPGREVVVASGRSAEDVRRDLRPLARIFSPETTFLYRLTGEAYVGIEALAPFVADMEPAEGETRFYVCRNWSCERPTEDLHRVIGQLRGEGEATSDPPPGEGDG